MKIKNLEITSPATLDFEIEIDKPICVLRGQHSELVSDLIRELIGDYGSQCDPDSFDDGRFVIQSSVEIDGKNYDVCYIRNADFLGDNRIAANFEMNSFGFSKDDTNEFVNKCNGRDVDLSNVIYDLKSEIRGEDDRPIFIYCSDLVNASALVSAADGFVRDGRQVFVAVSTEYPEISAPDVQNINVG